MMDTLSVGVNYIGTTPTSNGRTMTLSHNLNYESVGLVKTFRWILYLMTRSQAVFIIIGKHHIMLSTPTNCSLLERQLVRLPILSKANFFTRVIKSFTDSKKLKAHTHTDYEIMRLDATD